jgi:tetratricopeptide (TPR) repeat protein
MRITIATCLVALLIVVGGVMSPVRAQEVVRLHEPGVDGSVLTLPDSAVGRTDIASAIRARDWERAERLLAEEIDRQPRSQELHVLIARIFFIDDKPLNTAVALKKAEAIAPLANEPRFLLALAYVRLKRGEWARPELERLVGAEPANPTYHYWIGRLDYDAGKYVAAIARFREALERDATLMRAYDNLGLCYEMIDEPDKAITSYREAIRLNRLAVAKSPWPPLNLGVLLRQRGELDEAESLIRESLRHDSRLASAHYQLGALLEQRGRIDDASLAFGEAAALDRSYAEPHYALARIYRRLGQQARADAALATFLRLRGLRTQSQP